MTELPDTQPTTNDLSALAEAVRETARPEPPRLARTQASWISCELTPELFTQLVAWRTGAARQLGREQVA